MRSVSNLTILFLGTAVLALLTLACGGPSASSLPADQTANEEQAAEPAAVEAVHAEPAPVPSQPKPIQTPPAPKSPPPPPPPPKPVVLTVPAETAFDVEFIDALSSEANLAGDAFVTRLTHDIVIDGEVALPAGSLLRGSVVEAIPTKKIGGQAKIAMEFDRIELPDGAQSSFSASLVQEAKSSKGKDAATIGGATAGGALLGRVLDKKHGTKGTALGAVVGAAVGTAVAAKNESEPVNIDPGVVLTLYSAAPLEVVITGGKRSLRS